MIYVRLQATIFRQISDQIKKWFGKVEVLIILLENRT